MLIITALAASILSVLYVMLSLNIVSIRRAEKISIGDEGNAQLSRAIRAQGNLVEYAPIALILMACLEVNGSPRLMLAPLALAFVAGRLLHPIGIKKPDEMGMRVLGMQLTLVSILALAALNVLWLLWLLFT